MALGPEVVMAADRVAGQATHEGPAPRVQGRDIFESKQ